MIGRRRLQPEEPPPDLVLEIDVTSKTSLDAYKAIKVPEIWIYDSGQLTIYLWENGQYISSNISSTFPTLPITKLIPATVERAWEIGSVEALEEFEVWSRAAWLD